MNIPPKQASEPRWNIYRPPIVRSRFSNPFSETAEVYGFQELAELYAPGPPIENPDQFITKAESMLEKDSDIALITSDYIAFTWLTGGKGTDVKGRSLSQRDALNILTCAAHQYNPANPEQEIEIFTNDVDSIKKSLDDCLNPIGTDNSENPINAIAYPLIRRKKNTEECFTHEELQEAANRIKETHWRDLFLEEWEGFTKIEKDTLEENIRRNCDARSLTNTPASAAGDLKFVIGQQRIVKKKHGGHFFDVDTQWYETLPPMNAPYGILVNRSCRGENENDNVSEIEWGELENQAVSLPHGSLIPQEILKKLIYCHARINKELTENDQYAQKEAQFFLPSEKKIQRYENWLQSLENDTTSPPEKIEHVKSHLKAMQGPLQRPLLLKWDSTRLTPADIQGYKFELMNYKDIGVIYDVLEEFGFGDNSEIAVFLDTLCQEPQYADGSYFIPPTEMKWNDPMQGRHPASAPPDVSHAPEPDAKREDDKKLGKRRATSLSYDSSEADVEKQEEALAAEEAKTKEQEQEGNLPELSPLTGSSGKPDIIPILPAEPQSVAQKANDQPEGLTLYNKAHHFLSEYKGAGESLTDSYEAITDKEFDAFVEGCLNRTERVFSKLKRSFSRADPIKNNQAILAKAIAKYDKSSDKQAQVAQLIQKKERGDSSGGLLAALKHSRGKKDLQSESKSQPQISVGRV